MDSKRRARAGVLRACNAIFRIGAAAMLASCSYSPTFTSSAVGWAHAGLVTTLAGQAGTTGPSDGTGQAALFYQPRGLANDGSTLYIADSLNHAIRAMNLATGRVSTVAGKPGTPGSSDGTGSGALFDRPENIALDAADGLLYISDTFNDTIRRLDLADRSVVTIAGVAGTPGGQNGTGTAARFNHPRGIVFDSATSCLYVADSFDEKIRQIDLTDFSVTTVAGNGTKGSSDGTGAAARFDDPGDLALSPGGSDLYIADTGNDTLRDAVVGTWTVVTIAGSAGQSGAQDGMGASARFNAPSGIATDGTSIFVGDTGNDTIRSVAIASGTTSTIAGEPLVASASDGLGPSALFSAPTCISVGTDRRTGQSCLYVADTGNQTIRETFP
jgi:hypothetical protein